MDIKTTLSAAWLALLLVGWCGCSDTGDDDSGGSGGAGTGGTGTGGTGTGGTGTGGTGTGGTSTGGTSTGGGGAGGAGSSDIEEFCTVVCEVCFYGRAPWHQDTIENCIPECVADFDDCDPADIPTILECTGGPECPEGMIGWGTCVAPYTCLL